MTANLFNKLNNISQNIKNLKEKRKAAQKQFEAQAKEEEKAIKQLKTGTPTGAAASVKDSNVNKDQSSNSSLRLTGGVEIDVLKDEIINKNAGKSLTSQEKIQEYMSEYKKVLINTLSSVFYPPALIKYNIDELEQLIKKSNLLPALKEKIMASSALQALTEKMIGGNYNRTKYGLSGISGVDVQGTLDLAHGEKNMLGKNYLMDTIKLENYNDPILKNHKGTIIEKEKEQFEKDYGFNIDNIPGYYFKDYSEPSKRIAENKDFHNILKKYKNHILTKNKDFNSVNFPKHGPLGVLGDSNLHNSIGKADILDYYFDKEGNLHMKLFDTYEFNKDAKDFLNKAGRSQMQQGNLKPYFSVYDIIVPKQDLEKIWNN